MDQQVYAMKIADIFNTEVRRKIFSGVNRKLKPVFPSPDSLYSKDIVKKHDTIQTSVFNVHPNNHGPGNHLNNLNIGFSSGASQNFPTPINNKNVAGNNYFNFSNSKKKYFEDDNNNNTNGVINSKNGFLGKNKKGIGKLQYREKIISSSINNNSINIGKTDNEKTEIPDKCGEIEKNNLNGTNDNITLNNQIIPEADMNSNETTSTSSKDDNFLTNNKQSEILIHKKDENNFGELIEIIKFDSGTLNKLRNENSVTCKDINKLIFNSTNSETFTTNALSSNYSNYKNLYSWRESSRFDFANKGIISQNVNNKNHKNNVQSKHTENVEIPDFVLKLIQKKVSRQNFTKKFEFMEDILYNDDLLNNEYINENHWAEFIIENKTMDTDKELIFDFENINKSLKDKFKTYYLK